jgi:hypothetical protein
LAEDVAIGPISPSSCQLALARGVGENPSMPSSVAVIADGVEARVAGATDDPGTIDVPLKTSTRSKSVPLTLAFAAITLSDSPIFAACATLTWMILVGGARTSMAVARERAMTRIKRTEDAIIAMRCLRAMAATLKNENGLWRRKM